MKQRLISEIILRYKQKENLQNQIDTLIQKNNSLLLQNKQIVNKLEIKYGLSYGNLTTLLQYKFKYGFNEAVHIQIEDYNLIIMANNKKIILGRDEIYLRRETNKFAFISPENTYINHYNKNKLPWYRYDI